MKRTWLALPALVALLACEPARRDIGPGSNPQSGTMHVSRDGSRIYVLSQDHAAVLVIDAATKEVQRQITVGERPVAMAMLPNGRLAVANRGSDSVSIVNPDSGMEENQVFVGTEPSAVAAKGDKVLVTLAIDQQLVQLDPVSGNVEKRINLPREEPAGIAVLSNGLVYVTHFYGISRAEGGMVSVIDLAQLPGQEIVNRIFVNTPSNPLLMTNQLASLTVSPSEDEVAIPNQETNNDPGGFNTGTPPPTAAYYVDGPSGMPAVVPGVATLDPRGHINTSDAEPPNGLTCRSCGITPGATEPKDPNKIYNAPNVFNVFDTFTYGEARLNTPMAVAYVDGGRGKLVLFRGSQNVLLLRNKYFGNQDPVVAEYKVGAGADGIAVSPDGKKAFVYSQFDYTLHEIDIENVQDASESQGVALVGTPGSKRQDNIRLTQTLAGLSKVTVAKDLSLTRPANITADIQAGRKVFFGATDDAITPKGAVSCASCHPNGRSDGMNWTFGTAKIRNTPQLGGGISETAPFHWEENDRPDQASMNRTVQAFMGGTGLTQTQITQLFKFIDTIPKAKSPVANKVEMQEAIVRGAEVFFSAETQCSTCHVATTLFTDNKVYGNDQVQTAENEPGVRFNTPVLAGLAASAPYLHDGRPDANTLEKLVDNYVATNKMGHGSHLTVQQKADLVAFLKSL